MRLRRCHMEAALLAGTSLHVIRRLAASSLSGRLAVDAVSMTTLTCLAIWQELAKESHAHGFVTKRAASQGLALGALTVPWCFGTLLSWAAGSTEARAFCTLAFRASAAASCAFLAALAARGTRLKARPARGLTAAAPQLLLAAFLVASPLLEGTTPEPAQLPAASAALIALTAAAGCAACHLALTALPKCFTIGEAMVVTQGLALLLADSTAILAALVTAGPQWTLLHTALGPRDAVQAFVELLLTGALGAAATAAHLLLALARQGRGLQQPRAQLGKAAKRWMPDTEITVEAGRLNGNKARPGWQLALGIAEVGLLFAAVAAAVRPAVWALGLAFETPRRSAVLGYWAAVLAAALPCMDWLSRRSSLPTIVVRKGYHLLAMALFTPALLREPQLLSVGLAVAFAALLAAEAVRVGQLPVVGHRIHSFMTSFIDDRDAGLLLVSHFSLLLGMAIPVWLCNPRAGSGSTSAAFAGIVVLGVADSAASVLGRRFGRHRILETLKTVEGTLGGMVSNLLVWCLLAPWLGGKGSFRTFARASVATCLLEAATTQLDNIFLPLHHLVWLL